ncbi:MAG: carbon-nitrogen hydrolase family protein [Rhodospirillales bacterium]|nr:carbon-nitrogen hydrolase family protein [Rhodospirillales bacterium]
MRVAAAQYALKPVASFEAFADQATAAVAAAAEFDARLFVLPEYLTTQLLSIPANGRPGDIRDLPAHTPQYRDLFSHLARSRAMHILAGTHVTAEGNKLYNTAYLFHPDGRVDTQEKLHLTPTETGPWGLAPGTTLKLIDLSWAKAAILVCYDVEFPELARRARAEGADLLLVPSCTDDRHGFHRVRYCAQARAIEDQTYVVVAATVGGLPEVEHLRSHVGEAALLAPCDYPFPPGGVLAAGEINCDMVVAADLDFAALARARAGGSVRTWQDRRPDLYRNG